MNTNSHNTHRYQRTGKLTLLATSILLIQINPALADVNSDIKNIFNTANATYVVQGHSAIVNTSTSNTVNVQSFSVPKYDVKLTQPLTITLNPGDEVLWKNTLTNNGLFDETVALTPTVPSTLSNFQIYIDADNNGIVDGQDKPLEPTISIKAGEQIHLIVKALTSSTLTDGEKVAVPLTAVVQEDKTVTASATDDLVAIVPTIDFKDPDYQNKVDQTKPGEPVFIEVGLALCNTNPDQVDYVWINVKSDKTGDMISLKAVETGANTGKYRVTAPTELNANAINDAIIQTLADDKLRALGDKCESATGKEQSLTGTTQKNLTTDINVYNRSASLQITKDANVKTAEIGDFVDYTINVTNNGESDANNVVIKDDLPLGFTYVSNSAQVDINGQKYAQNFVSSGKYMTLGLNSLQPKQTAKVTYRVVLGANAASGTGTNIAFAEATDALSKKTVQSKQDDAHVEVSKGVLNTDGIIIGKVYADFNRDGIQQKEQNELGVAGVRLYLEDGTFVVTDSEGKYSVYGQKAKTHVIKLDRTTLPRGVELVEQTNRNAGDPGSRFVDLRYGELHRADFGITEGIDNNNNQGNPALIAELQKRAKQVIAKNDALEQSIKTDLELEPSFAVDNNVNLESVGCKNPNKIDGQISCESVITDNQTPSNKTTKRLEVNPIAPVQAPDIDRALSTADDKRIAGVTADADFLNLKDNQRVDSQKIRVQIKAPGGANTVLLVNGTAVDKSLMGKEVAWEKDGISGFDYYAVPLSPGQNTLSIQSTDLTGKFVSSKSIGLYAPKEIADIITRTQSGAVEADGVSEYQVAIKLTDTDNGQYAAPTSITLDSDIGTILVKDNEPNQAGIQSIINGGEILVSVRAPNNPGKGNLVVKAGNLQKIVPLQFTPQLRPLIAAGIVEGAISFNNIGSKIESVTKNDGFEEELKSLSGDDKDSTSTHGRAAFFLKGKVRGDMLLTMAYDSDKNKYDRLFRDINPDSYYPVYGDASAKGFDAQSSDKFYVRLDKGRSFVMYGDMKTHIDNEEGLSLGQYDRTLTGAKAHFENDKAKVTAFAAQTSSRQNVIETRGLGISGPYPTGVKDFADLLLNSETVEVLVRDRNNPGTIISRQALNRYSDYEIDSISHAIYLRSPIASTDIDGNPIYLRVTVEADNVGEEYTIVGTAGNYQLTKNVKVGASYAQSDDPTNNETLSGINSVVKFNDKVKLVAEVAHYESDKVNDTLASAINANALGKDSSGDAARIELTYKDKNRDGKLYYNQADEGFTSTSSPITAGRTETGLNLTNRINAKTSLKAEAIQTKDATNDSKRQGATVSIERKLTDILTGELGVRYYEKDAKAASTNYQSVVNTDPFNPAYNQSVNQSLRPSVTNNDSDYQGTTLRGKLTADLAKLNKSKVFVEYEQDIDDSSRKAWSVGGETSLMNKGRLYARHEFASSLTGDYGLDTNDEHQSTIVGVDANYMKDGQVFSEYRVKDGMSSRESEAAIGLRNKWKVKDGVYVNTSLEHLESIEGERDNTATAATVGVDYLASDKYKVTGRVEKRWGVQSDTLLTSFGYANKVNDDVTLLAKNIYSNQQDNTQNKDRTIDRFQIGMAYRDFDNNISDHLAKLEYRYDNNGLDEKPYQKQTYIASLHSNYHPVRRLTLSGHYAGKYNELTMDGITSDSTTQLLSGRAMYDINERWDAGIQAGTMWSDNNSSNYLLGAEVGYSPMANLWISAGYNFMGYHDDDIANGSDNQQGGYVRLRYKFDEDLFNKKRPVVNSRLMADDEVATK